MLVLVSLNVVILVLVLFCCRTGHGTGVWCHCLVILVLVSSSLRTGVGVTLCRHAGLNVTKFRHGCVGTPCRHVVLTSLCVVILLVVSRYVVMMVFTPLCVAILVFDITACRHTGVCVTHHRHAAVVTKCGHGGAHVILLRHMILVFTSVYVVVKVLTSVGRHGSVDIVVRRKAGVDSCVSSYRCWRH